MDSIRKLSEMFGKFPGIGPRQAKRFVYYLLSRDDAYLRELMKHIGNIKKEIVNCSLCGRFFSLRTNISNENPICDICIDSNRDKSILLIVSKDIDFENIERSGVFKGLYFILGGFVPILEKEPETKIKQREMFERIEKAIPDGLKEIILAMNLNADGENTEIYLRNVLEPLITAKNIKISTLGRGLSTGTELEYSDSETLKYALQGRFRINAEKSGLNAE